MSKPDGYPLPWCEELDLAYWELNMWLIIHKEGWQDFQSKKYMDELIPIIRKEFQLEET